MASLTQSARRRLPACLDAGDALNAFVLTAALLLLAGGGSNLHAGQALSGHRLVTAPGDTLVDNLLGVGESVLVGGTVLGDVIAAARIVTMDGSIADNAFAAAQSISLEGRVGADAVLLAQHVEVDGAVGSDLRGAAESFALGGVVARDVVVAAELVNIGPAARIGGDLFVGAEMLHLEGTVQGRVLAGVERLVLAGVIEGSLDVWADTIEVLPGARVEGNLNYHRRAPLNDIRAIERSVQGAVVHRTAPEKPRVPGLPGRIWLLLSTLATAAVLIGGCRPRLRLALEALVRRPWHLLATGGITLLATPVAVVLLAVLVITIPLSLVLGVLYLAGLYVSWVLLATVAGTLVLTAVRGGTPRFWLGGLLGVVVLWLLAMIPGLGGLLCLLATVSGLGMLASGLRAQYREPGRTAHPPQPEEPA